MIVEFFPNRPIFMIICNKIARSCSPLFSGTFPEKSVLVTYDKLQNILLLYINFTMNDTINRNMHGKG